MNDLDFNYEDAVRKNILSNPTIKSYLDKGWKFASMIERDKVYLIDENNNQAKINPDTGTVIKLDPYGYRM